MLKTKNKKKMVLDNSISVSEGIELLKKACTEKQRKFIENVDLAVNLTIDPKQTSQNVRGSVSLPSGTGKNVKVVVFTDNDLLKQEAMNSGAIDAGLDELMERISTGWLGFDYCIATPDAMKKIGKIAKILGPRALMPNPKNGNITNEIAKTVKEVMKGKVDFKNDKFGIIHIGIGKISFSTDDLLANVKAVVTAIRDAKPDGIKGGYIKSIFLTSTMGPSFLISVDKQ